MPKNTNTTKSGRSHLLFIAAAILQSRTVTAYRRVDKSRLTARVAGNVSATTHEVLAVDHSRGKEWSSRGLLDEHLSAVIESLYGRNLEDNADVRELPEDHLVTSLPLLEDGKFLTRHYAGHVDASADGEKKLFYWLFEPDFSDASASRKDEDIPLIIWLNGGPGCSSMDGLFLENGPFRIIPPNEEYEHSPASSQDISNWRIEINPYSWHKAPAYTLYIDQPVGTGLSFSKGGNWAKSDLEVNVDFYLFLQNFLMLHKDKFVQDVPMGKSEGQVDETVLYQMIRPLFFSGESHAGHYIPSMLDYILEQNDQLLGVKKPENGRKGGHDRGLESLQQGSVIINIQGAAIGNGWVDPVYQYSGAKAAYGMGLIDDAQLNALNEQEIDCQENLRQGSFLVDSCFNLLESIISGSDGGSAFKVSTYDNRRWESSTQPRVFPPGYTVVESFLGNIQENPHARGAPPAWNLDSAAVLASIHAAKATLAGQYYMECTDPPYDALSHQDGKGVVPEVVRILNHPGIDGNPIKMLFFSGIHDLICNHAGNEDFLNDLPWSETANWIVSERFVWAAGGMVENGHPAGYMKQHKNLLFLKVLNAGHMVPMDQPQVALKMISTFIYNESFGDNPQQLQRSIAKSKACRSDDTSSPVVDLNGESNTINVLVDSKDKDVLIPLAVNGNAVSNSVIMFAWIAALFAITALFLYAAMKRRGTSRFVVASTLDDEEFYRDSNSIEVT